MTRHFLMPEAAALVAGYNPRQYVFFSLESRRASARVVYAAIARDPVARHARSIGGVCRGGYVVNGVAEVGQ